MCNNSLLEKRNWKVQILASHINLKVRMLILLGKNTRLIWDFNRAIISTSRVLRDLF